MNAPRILIAEDEEIDVILLRRAFQAAGHDAEDIKVVGNGEEALDYIRGLDADGGADAPPALFLLDINMPRCSGLEVLERLQGTRWHRLIPTVIFSSSNHPSDIERAYRLGAHGYLVKPTSNTQRATMVKTLCDYWIEMNRAPRPAVGAGV